MSSLRDQMLKAGLVSKKQARQSQHQRRVEKTKKGSRGLAEERAQKQAAVEQQQAKKRAQDKQREQARNERTDARNAQQRIGQIVAGGRKKLDDRGNRSFYFETRDGRVLYLSVSDQQQGDLVDGRLGIVESPTGKVSVIDRETARRVAELDATWIRRLNG